MTKFASLSSMVRFVGGCGGGGSRRGFGMSSLWVDVAVLFYAPGG